MRNFAPRAADAPTLGRVSEYLIRPGRAEDEDTAVAVENSVWAPFLWQTDQLPDWQYDMGLWVVAEHDGEIVASADGQPLEWDETLAGLPADGWQGVLARAAVGYSRQPAWACALGTSVLPEHRRGGLSARMLVALKERAALAGYRGMLAPARPSHRALMPQLSIEEYAALRLSDGRHADPWLRVHEALGGSLIGVCPHSLTLSAPRADWEAWLSMRLPERARLIPPGSTGWLDVRDGVGTLIEDSVWVRHDIAGV